MTETSTPKLDQENAKHLLAALDLLRDEAEEVFAADALPSLDLSERLRASLAGMSKASSQASTAFTNVMTCLAIKALFPDIDIRYHQVQIGAPFNFRTVSEKHIYPWLQSNRFEGAKSGWQTRTFERPKPYLMSYDENIGSIKESFLTVFDEIQENSQNPRAALSALIYDQVVLRDKKSIPIISPKVDDIRLIESFFREHFFAKYKAKGASRLPVLALYAIHSVMLEQLQRYDGMKIRELQSHSAADAQTGAIGDIEIERQDSTLFEGLEIKHNQKITEQHIETACEKFSIEAPPDRYYILTTHDECQPDQSMNNLLLEKRNRIGTQIIVNGVLPTIRYYLRLLKSPNSIFPIYGTMLSTDKAISFEHRTAWNEIIIGKHQLG